MIVTKMSVPGYLTSSNLLLHADSVPRSPAYFLTICVHKTAHSFGRILYLQFPLFCLAQPSLSNKFKRWGWSIRSSADGNSLNSSPVEDTSGETRLIRTIKSFQINLDKRIKELRKNLPMKLLFFLVGFYCATAFATVIGQTGDWDILSAALAVAIVEGIGALMYGASIPLIGNARSLITMFNYWKAGLSLASCRYLSRNMAKKSMYLSEKWWQIDEACERIVNREDKGSPIQRAKSTRRKFSSYSDFGNPTL